MITDLSQRWNTRRSSYRPAGEIIRTAEYEVAALPERVAKAFVLEHHYSGTYPAARFRFGLWHHGVLAGTAVFSVPVNYNSLKLLPGDPRDSVELGRFVLLDTVPGNGETWFLGRCWELLRGQVVGVVSFSDPMPRSSASGTVTHGGHVGTIDQAHNAVYLGLASPRTMYTLPDGTVLNARSLSKIRKRDRGHQYATEVLERHGATPLRETDDARAWLRHWLPIVTRAYRHAGNHKYIWALDKAAKRRLPASLPYPKIGLA